MRFHHTISLSVNINSEQRQQPRRLKDIKSQIKASIESEIDEVAAWMLLLACRLQQQKRRNVNGFFYIFALVFNEKLCETTILKFINDRENM